MRRFLPSSSPLSTCQILKATTSSHFPQKKTLPSVLFKRQACCIVLRDKLEGFLFPPKVFGKTTFGKWELFFLSPPGGQTRRKLFFRWSHFREAREGMQLAKKKYAYRHTRNSPFFCFGWISIFCFFFRSWAPRAKTKFKEATYFPKQFRDNCVFLVWRKADKGKGKVISDAAWIIFGKEVVE